MFLRDLPVVSPQGQAVLAPQGDLHHSERTETCYFIYWKSLQAGDENSTRLLMITSEI